MPVHTTDDDFETGSTRPQPRLRINRTDTLNLTTTWQRVDFSGTSIRNINTFPTMSDGRRKVMWDKTAKALRFTDTVDRNYDMQLSVRSTSVSLLTVVSLTIVKVHLRFVVPTATPVYFPLPDAPEPYVDLHPVNLTAPSQATFGIPIYANSQIRDAGLGVELRLSAALANVQLTAADLIVYGR